MPSPSQYSGHYFDESAPNNSWSNIYRYISPGARVLDVGCSTGNFGAALAELKQCEVVGVDISEEDIAVARTRISEAYVLDITVPGAAEKLGTFDFVIFADVLEHLVDPRATLRAVHHLLNEGGGVVYSIPHMGHLSVRLDLMEGRFPYTELGLLDRTHLHYYDRLEVHDVFAAAGFAITSEDPVVSGYPQAWTTERLSTMGLKVEPRFFDLMQKTEAHVFQYVGVAMPSSDVPPLSAESRKMTAPPDDLLAAADRTIAENTRLASELHELRLRVALWRREPIRAAVEELRHRLARRIRRGM